MAGNEAHTFVVYIDESGNEDIRSNDDWFILSALIVDIEKDKELPEIRNNIIKKIDEVEREKSQKNYIHMREIRKEDKKLFIAKEVAEISSTCCISIISYIPFMHQKLAKKLSKKDGYYYHMLLHLIQRISWYCHDCKNTHEDKNCKAKIIFSKRGKMSREKFQRYLNQIRKNEIHYKKKNKRPTANWDFIDIDAIEVKIDKDSAGLQLVDVVAYSFYKAVQKNRFAMLLPYYAEFFEDNVYKKDNVAWGRGVTILEFKSLLEKYKEHIPERLCELFKP